MIYYIENQLIDNCRQPTFSDELFAIVMFATL